MIPMPSKRDNASEPKDAPRDLISSLAGCAPILVAVKLVINVVNGEWASVAFTALIFAVVLIVYFYLFYDLDDDMADGEPSVFGAVALRGGCLDP